MTVLIDQPMWPAHNTLWAHLVSDDTLDELHAFAAGAGLPVRAFDHDHYDVPEAKWDEIVALGATPVGVRELVERLAASGLRVSQRDKRARSDTRERATRDDGATRDRRDAPDHRDVRDHRNLPDLP